MTEIEIMRQIKKGWNNKYIYNMNHNKGWLANKFRLWVIWNIHKENLNELRLTIGLKYLHYIHYALVLKPNFYYH